MMVTSKKRLRIAVVLSAVGLAILVSLGILAWQMYSPWHQSRPASWGNDPADPRVIVVETMTEDGDPRHVRVDVKETADSVQIFVSVWMSGESGPALGHPVMVSVRLREPVNGRQVVDVDGRPVDQRRA